MTVGILLCCLLLLTLLERFEESEARVALPDNPLPPVAVVVRSVEKGPVSGWVVSEGVAEAVRKRHLQFETAGKVTYLAMDDGLPLREGMFVRGPLGHGDGERGHGQLLARIDRRDAQADIRRSEAGVAESRRGIEMERSALAQATNDLDHAKTDLDRKKTLLEKGLLARSEYDLAKTAHDNAVQAVDGARARFAAARSKELGAVAALEKSSRGQERTALFAPFDGIIARINIRQGDWYDPADVQHADRAKLLATAPITIIDPSEMEVTLNLPVFDGIRVQAGQRVAVVPGGRDWFREGDEDDGNEPSFFGQVYSVSPQLDGEGRSVRVKVRLHQRENLLPDGMYTTCFIRVEHRAQVLRVPVGSLLYRDDAPFVYVVQDNVAQERVLRLGLEDEAHVEVLEGVKAGDRVVTRGRDLLSSDYPVRVLEDADGS